MSVILFSSGINFTILIEKFTPDTFSSDVDHVGRSVSAKTEIQ